MSNSRLADYFREQMAPSQAQAIPAPGGFMVCPSVLIAGLNPVQQFWQNALYQIAFEQALAAARPSLPERDLLGVWN
jgi:hypothetical protein